MELVKRPMEVLELEWALTLPQEGLATRRGRFMRTRKGLPPEEGVANAKEDRVDASLTRVLSL